MICFSTQCSAAILMGATKAKLDSAISEPGQWNTVFYFVGKNIQTCL